MPWSPDRYPPAMRRLPPRVRLKAIEIANALLDEGHDEGQAIRIGIAKARQWALRRTSTMGNAAPFGGGADRGHS